MGGNLYGTRNKNLIFCTAEAFLRLNLQFAGIVFIFFEGFSDMEEDESVGEIDGLFKRFHFAVLKELSDEDLARLAAYQNDTDRLTFVYSLPCVSKCIKSTMSSNKRIFRPKSASEARDARLRGNKAFQMKNHQQALQLYTAAVVNAPAFHQGILS